jgi:2-polyprenyl-3-methyl-5-hydroxy-6-metoxy-1,4-benzoquinol methylase
VAAHEQADETCLVEGTLICAGCAATVVVRGGVPRFVPDANYASGFGLQWRRHARTQLDSANGTRISEQRFFAQTAWPRQLSGETVLEVGSGAGRFTEQAASTGATVVSVEYSNAVDANASNNASRPNVLFVQADLFRMPLAPATFDRVACLGVLQHTPSPAEAFGAIARMVRPGGYLSVDIYRRPSGLERLLKTRYLVRPLTRRIPPRILYPITRRYVLAMWPLATLIHRIPRVGRRINWALQIADYRDTYPLSEDQLREWAVLDTFDMLAPRYDSPQDASTLRDWFETAGFVDVSVASGVNGWDGRGRKRTTISHG